MIDVDEDRDVVAAAIAEAIGATGDAATIQRIQSRFRLELTRMWGIAPGARVLEIGCGQGDTTAALAAVVGPDGHVTAIDRAGPGYGGPTTLGEATRRIEDSTLGARVDFRLGCDLLSRPALGDFDCVVFAHCAWYFRSSAELERTITAARDYAPTLCLSEWDTAVRDVRQFGHMLAVQILGVIAAVSPAHGGNIQTALPRAAMRGLIARAGWAVETDRSVAGVDLQDGGWEIALALDVAPEEFAAVGRASPRLEGWLRAQQDLLRDWVGRVTRIAPLDSFAIRASRGSAVRDPRGTGCTPPA